MNSRLGPRVTREPGASRVPIATSLWPVSSGATSGSSARRSVERSTSMYATTRAALRDQAVRSARPRPFCSSRSTLHPAERDRQRPRDLRRRVGAGVVGDQDPPRERHRAREVAVQAPDRERQRALLVVDRDDDLEVDRDRLELVLGIAASTARRRGASLGRRRADVASDPLCDVHGFCLPVWGSACTDSRAAVGKPLDEAKR